MVFVRYHTGSKTAVSATLVCLLEMLSVEYLTVQKLAILHGLSCNNHAYLDNDFGMAFHSENSAK